jgi:hypothetical protein
VDGVTSRFVEGRQMTDNQAKPTKADLRKMLAEAVLNTPGATQLQPVRDPPPKPKPNKRAEMKPLGKTRRAGASSSHKSPKTGVPVKRRTTGG